MTRVILWKGNGLNTCGVLLSHFIIGLGIVDRIRRSLCVWVCVWRYCATSSKSSNLSSYIIILLRQSTFCNVNEGTTESQFLNFCWFYRNNNHYAIIIIIIPHYDKQSIHTSDISFSESLFKIAEFCYNVINPLLQQMLNFDCRLMVMSLYCADVLYVHTCVYHHDMHILCFKYFCCLYVFVSSQIIHTVFWVWVKDVLIGCVWKCRDL